MTRITSETRRIGITALACAIGLLSGCVVQSTKPEAAPAEPVAQEPSRPPCPQGSARDLELESIEWLDRGDTERARHLLDCAIEESPDSRRAKLLIRQLDADPVSFLGARHYLYTVQLSETLSKIAQERLGDDLKFVILARYNDIRVPANLVAGQQIKIPGTRPTESPEPTVVEEEPQQPTAATEPVVESAPPPSDDGSSQRYDDALALEQRGELDGAYSALSALKAEGADLPSLDADLARVRSALVAGLENKAWSFELAGNIDEAVATWQRLLKINPGNIPAQLSVRRLTQ